MYISPINPAPPISEGRSVRVEPGRQPAHPVDPIEHVPAVFSRWLERRRQNIEEQLAALDEERYADLLQLIGDADDDVPPAPQGDLEYQEYLRLLEDNRRLGDRLIEMRGRILDELRSVDRRRVSAPPSRRRGGRGGSLDGYL